ncbi:MULTISPECIES: hypothetical protein [Rhodomicrobium]|uniref:hypothetical protein n=1 Tax=Rhodomicrobium TaxID=1068 RepID=UPI000B4BC480|nr:MULTISPECIES: hypothetical protein [Rhodomicrobium]
MGRQKSATDLYRILALSTSLSASGSAIIATISTPGALAAFGIAIVVVAMMTVMPVTMAAPLSDRFLSLIIAKPGLCRAACVIRG